MITTFHSRMKFTLAMLLSLISMGAMAQCGGVRPTFEWHSEGGMMHFADVTDHAFQSPDSVTWTSFSGISAQGASMSYPYATAGIDTVTMNVWRNSCAISTTAVVPHGGVSDQCLSPVYGSFSWAATGNNAVAFQDASITGGQQVVEFWDLGDGVIDLTADPSHFYLFPGAYDVSHSISTVDTSSLCMAGRAEHIFVDGNTSTCDSSLFLAMNVSSFGPPTSFDVSIAVFNAALEISNSLWAFGDGQVDVSSGPNTLHVYNDPGEYQACITVNAFNTQTQQACYAMACGTVQAAAVGVLEHAGHAPLRAWPIPFAYVLNVEGPAVVNGAQWSIYDGLGQEVSHGRITGVPSLQLHTMTLRAGPYVLWVRSDTRSSTLLIMRE